MLYTPEAITVKNSDFIHVRDKLMEAEGITLDGCPAYIGGRLKAYATVWCPDDLHQANFSWECVKRIVESTKRFFSE